MKELMIHVERIVRPVKADVLKMRMRRELLAHLKAAFDEERSGGLDEQTALKNAKRRLGEPLELTRQLQASVPRLDRLSAVLGGANLAPFPKWVGLLGLTGASLAPVSAAIALAQAWLMSPFARLALVTAIIVMELQATALYILTVRLAGMILQRRWGLIACLGAPAITAQAAWLLLVSSGLSGHAVLQQRPLDFALDVIAAAAVLLGFALIYPLVKLPAERWLSLDLGDQSQ